MTPDVAAGPGMGRTRLLRTGWTALRERDWARGRECFERALADRPGPEAREGLGKARYWMGDYPEALELLAEAHREYREQARPRAAANVAVHLAQLHALVHGDVAAMAGWLGHAERLVDVPGRPSRETGWVELFKACITPDPRERQRRAGVAVDLGRRFGDAGLEFDGLAYLGKALVEQGEVDVGMGLLDESVTAATGGLVRDPWAMGDIYCALFHACELVGDMPRASQWLDAVDRYVADTGELPIHAICRTHWAGVLVAGGRWEEASRELAEASQIFASTYRGTRVEPIVRLADLRVRQGRLEEAAELLRGWEDHPGAAVARARLALAEGRGDVARDVLVRRFDDATTTLADASALALLVDAELATGHPRRAHVVVERLHDLAAATNHPAVRGRAALAAARAALAEGRDPGQHLSEALSALSVAELPWELGLARLDHARWSTTAHPQVAREQARLALTTLERLGAREADEAAQLLRSLGDHGRAQPRTTGVLTNRQREVLALVAEGLTNAEIAARLCISPRTVEDHVGNILQALGVDNRARAAAWAHRAMT